MLVPPLPVNKALPLKVWDVNGAELFLSKTYFRDALGIFIVYDVTHRASFDNLSRWMLDITKFGMDNATVMLIAHKTDLKHNRTVSYDEGKTIADRYGYLYAETSEKELDTTKAALVSSLNISASKSKPAGSQTCPVSLNGINDFA